MNGTATLPRRRVRAQARLHKTAAGKYWTCAWTRERMLDHMRSVDISMFKEAKLGDGTDQQFEQSFASLAYSYIKEKAPRLLDFLIGFQLLERDENSTKAVGVFGFYVGDQWLYVPVFFLNKDLKGYQLLYIKNKDTFVPLQEDWVDYMLSRRPHVLGEQSDTPRNLGSMQPDLTPFLASPSTLKRGMDLHAVGFLPYWASLKAKRAACLFRKEAGDLALSEVAAAPWEAWSVASNGVNDLNKLMPLSGPLIKLASDIADRYVQIKRGFDRFYGTDCFERWMGQYRQTLPDPRTRLLVEVPEKHAADAHPLKTGALQVFMYEDVYRVGGKAPLDADDRDMLAKNKVLVKDKRDPKDVSLVYHTQTEAKLSNPDKSGVYEILEKPGDFSRMLVIMHPVSNSGAHDYCTVVRLEGEDKAQENLYHTALWVQNPDNADKELRDYVDEAGGADSLQVGATYVAVNRKGAGTVPFKVTAKHDDGRYTVNFDDYGNRRPTWQPKSRPQANDYDSDDYVSAYGATLAVMPPTAGLKLRAIGGELRVPSEFKFIKLKSPPRPKGGLNIVGDYANEAPPIAAEPDRPRPICPGTIQDVQMMLMRNTSRLKVATDKHEYVITDDNDESMRFTGPFAMRHLVAKHGMAYDTAKDVLQEVDAHGYGRYLIKYAIGFGPNAPPIPEPDYGQEMIGRDSITAMRPQEMELPIEGMSARESYDPNQHDMWQNYTAEDFSKVRQKAQQAGMSGQKEVFDTSMLSSLLRLAQQDSMVDRYLGDLSRGMDRLGRILLLFYWHQEEFQERYGRQDLPELEDSLTSTMDQLGKLVMFLKKKTVREPFEDNADIDLEESVEG